MNHLNSDNLETAIVNTFQKILAEDPNFFFTNRLSVLTWKSKRVKGALVTKIGNLRYLGMLRQDSKGQDYWKYKLLTSEKSGGEPAIQPSSSADVRPSVKNEVPASSIERSLDAFFEEKGLEESERVKKFREKYGEFNEQKPIYQKNESKTSSSVKQ